MIISITVVVVMMIATTVVAVMMLAILAAVVIITGKCVSRKCVAFTLQCLQDCSVFSAAVLIVAETPVSQCDQWSQWCQCPQCCQFQCSLKIELGFGLVLGLY